MPERERDSAEHPHGLRVVASDLDGTLVRADGSVSPRTARVWSTLAARGIETVVVTARPPRWLHHLEELVGAESGAPSVAICANGAFVYDVHERRVLERHGFTPDEARALVEPLVAEFAGAAVAFETDRGAFRTPEYSEGDFRPLGSEEDVVVCALSDVPDDVVVGKILVRHPSWVNEEFVADVTSRVGSAGVLAYSGAAGLAEITAPGVTKAARLGTWCGDRGVSAQQVWAFGDMPNDLPMLAWAGLGVAVANAHPDVLAAADARCGSNADDGVAEYLARRLRLD